MLYSPCDEEHLSEPSMLINPYNSSSFTPFTDELNKTNSVTDVMLPNVFVQIPINNSTISAHRQNGEIKSEPIKSEIDNLVCITSAPVVTTSNSVARNQLSQSLKVKSSGLLTARPKSSIKCFKCTLCPFISISQNSLNTHTSSSHQNNSFNNILQVKRKLSCPGCENIFYSQKSLKIHLINDHQMSHSEIRVLLQSLINENESDVGLIENDSISTNRSVNENANAQKIYLKNVDVLKNPSLPSANTSTFTNEDSILMGQFNENPLGDYDENPNVCLIDLIDDEMSSRDNSEDIGQSVPLQQQEQQRQTQNKIYVKNDNILKDPQINQFNFINKSYNFEMIGLNKKYTSDMQVVNIIKTPPPPSTTPQICFSNNDDKRPNDGLAEATAKKPCKIFIKNVDILKKPMFLHTSGSTSISPQPHQFLNIQPSSLTGTDLVEMPPLIGGYDASFTFTSAPSRFLDNHTPTPNNQKKIFIKNIDILKKPVTFEPPQQENSRLHLRTVDELNLMNINEVQNLIENFQEEAPILDENEILVTQTDTDNYNEIPEYLNDNLYGQQDERVLETTVQDQNDDLINDFTNDTTDNFTFPIQIAHEDAADIYNETDFETMQFGVNNNLIVFDNIIDSTSSSIEEKSSKSEQINRENKTRDTTVPLCYSNVSELSEDNSGLLIDEAVIRSPNDYRCGLRDNILFVDEISPANNASENVNTVSPSNNTENQSKNASKIETGKNVDDIQKDSVLQKKGRIYVVGNLLKNPEPSSNASKQTFVDIISDEQSSRHKTTATYIDTNSVIVIDKANIKQQKTKKHSGRPRGMRKIDFAFKLGDENHIKSDIVYKCTQDCAMRFRTAEILSFHERCHDPVQKNGIICPECNQSDFKVWNTLHTHLWRHHQIDMELYSCELCSFRTPILSRLLNTHMKIHSDERNYKCTQCDKAFKNTKQLKNHRRIHTQMMVVRKCEYCDVLFYNRKHLANHIRSYHEKQDKFKCNKCNLMFSSIRARETHILNHNQLCKFHCTNCNYTSNDSNAYRRHRMTHTAEAVYICKYCDFKSIQSTTYMKHVSSKHPDQVDKIIFSCDQCKFNTINKRRYELHMLNHKQFQNNHSTKESMDFNQTEPINSISNNC